MSELPGESFQDQERSLLGGALSYEFSDCSIAAADLNKLVAERINHDKEKSGGNTARFVIGDGERPQQLVYSNIDYNHDFTIYGLDTQLVLAQRVSTREEVGHSKVRKWLVP